MAGTVVVILLLEIIVRLCWGEADLHAFHCDNALLCNDLINVRINLLLAGDLLS